MTLRRSDPEGPAAWRPFAEEVEAAAPEPIRKRPSAKATDPRRTHHPLTKLGQVQLRGWLLARMRGEKEDPPVSESRLESPDDYVRLVHDETTDARFQSRLEGATIAALKEAAKGNLRRGPDARAIRYLASLAGSLRLRAAMPVLLGIADRGALGGHEGSLAEDAEEVVLSALAGLQEPGALWPRWRALWDREIPRLWPVVTAGLRLSDPKRALAILPEAARRAERHAGLPLGEILWAFAMDERDVYRPEEITGALAGLPEEVLGRCREALRAVGADEGEIAAWVPDPAPVAAARAIPDAWWTQRAKQLPLRPPRLKPRREGAAA